MLKLRTISVVLIISLVFTFLSVGGVVYASESDFAYTLWPSGAKITGYTGIGDDVVIADFLGRMDVLCIGYNAFYMNKTIVNITLPNTKIEICKVLYMVVSI